MKKLILIFQCALFALCFAKTDLNYFILPETTGQHEQCLILDGDAEIIIEGFMAYLERLQNCGVPIPADTFTGLSLAIESVEACRADENCVLPVGECEVADDPVKKSLFWNDFWNRYLENTAEYNKWKMMGL